MSNERDTKFLGFAKLVVSDIYKQFGSFIDTGTVTTSEQEELGLQHELEALIAQRSYDLVAHTLGYVNDNSNLMMGIFSPEDIPDVTQSTNGHKS